MGGVTDLEAPAEETPDRGDPVPLETQLERHRPARLLTGEDARPPGPAPAPSPSATAAGCPPS
ncbi:hypothetical protein ACN24K_22600 [Streptomyces microflavus]